MMLRCIVVDDEPLAVRMLENFIERTPFLELDSSYTDPVLALTEISARNPHLVFLDIQMPDLNGMELSRMIPSGTRVVFTTAFKQYAFESYEVCALDFLLKPIRYQKFLEAARKAREWFGMKEAAAYGSAVSSDENVPSQDAPASGAVFIRTDGSMQKVDLSDILYVEGMKDYVRIFLESSRSPLVVHATMKSMEDMLPGNLFMRVHRSYIVALDKIESVSGSSDIVIAGAYIHVSDSCRAPFDAWLSTRSLLR